MNDVHNTGLSPQRLAVLEHQAHNKGLTPADVEKMQKRGEDPDKSANGRMIVVSPLELIELLAAYKEKRHVDSALDS